MTSTNFFTFFADTFSKFWGFLFTPLFEGISLGGIIISLFVLSLLITFFFRGQS